MREDGREGDVFSLIGPKRYDVPWKEMERTGFIAEASCREIRVPLGPDDRAAYLGAEPRLRHRAAAENRRKLEVVRHLAARHRGEPVLVIGTYLGQLERIAAEVEAPLIVGDTPQHRRESLYREFREGRHPVLVLSKVGNFSIDLPDAFGLHPGLGRVRIAPGGGAAARPHPAPQGARGELLQPRLPRHRRAGDGAEPPALPLRARLPLLHRGLGGRRARRGEPGRCGHRQRDLARRREGPR